MPGMSDNARIAYPFGIGTSALGRVHRVPSPSCVPTCRSCDPTVSKPSKFWQRWAALRLEAVCDVNLVIRAMRVRPAFYHLLPKSPEEML
jgi:hypothetical protein